MDIVIRNDDEHKLFIDSDAEHVDFCVLAETGEQYDFTVSKHEWNVICAYVEQKSNIPTSK